MKFTEKKAEILLIFVITARATSFVFNKQLLDHMGVFNILALRFVIAAVVMSVIFHKGMLRVTKREALAGLAVGGCYPRHPRWPFCKTRLSSSCPLLRQC